MVAPAAPSRSPKVKEAIDKFVSRVRHNIDVHLTALAGDLARAVETPSGGLVRVEQILADFERALSARPAEGGLDGAARLLAALRLVDDSTSLKGILDTLGRSAAAEALKVAVLVVEGDTLRRSADHGFLPGAAPADVPIDSFSVLARAVHERRRAALSSAAAAPRVDLPAALQPATGSAAVILPVAIGNQVVAVVYAEGPDRANGPSGPWAEHVEILTRHAASRLESMTSRRTVEVLTTRS